MKTIELNESWVSGTFTVNNHKVVINTAYSTISIDGARVEWFSQGQDADGSISLIHKHWLKNDCYVEDSIQWFINTYLL